MGKMINMPKFGLSMKRGTITKWFKNEGETIEKGDPLMEIETEKITNVVESPVSGTLLKVFRDPGFEGNVGVPMAFIGEPDEEIPQVAMEVEDDEGEGIDSPLLAAKKKRKARVKAAPVARKLAEAEGIDLTVLAGSGPGGVITRKDVEAYMASPQFKKIEEKVRLSGLMKAVGRNMVESAFTAPHVTLTMEIDVTEFMATRKKLLPQIQAETGMRLSLTEMLVKVVAEALMRYKTVNSTLDDDGNMLIYQNANIGVAVNTDMGLVVPVVHKADELTLGEIVVKTKELVKNAASGELMPDDMSGGTFTITNLGFFGIDAFTPIINPGECAILGIGAIREKPVVVDGAIAIRSMMTLSISHDHRTINGVPAAEFLLYIKDRVETPMKVFDEITQKRRYAEVTSAGGFKSTMLLRQFSMKLDEPEWRGGDDTAPNPVEVFIGAFGACLTMFFNYRASEANVRVTKTKTTVQMNVEGPLEELDFKLLVETSASQEEVEELLVRAEESCLLSNILDKKTVALNTKVEKVEKL